MRRLILFRHAKAEARAGAQKDIDRPLAARGREDATLMGRVLARKGLVPDLALVSDSRRTRETWERLAPAFPAAKARYAHELYNATAEELLESVDEAADGAEAVIVIGHNPGLHELAVNLLIDGGAAPSDIERMSGKFPTATAAAFLIDAEGRAAFDGLFFAADHGGQGE
jgi:phosphohistidine phosphatase